MPRRGGAPTCTPRWLGLLLDVLTPAPASWAPPSKGARGASAPADSALRPVTQGQALSCAPCAGLRLEYVNATVNLGIADTPQKYRLYFFSLYFTRHVASVANRALETVGCPVVGDTMLSGTVFL